MEKKHNSFPKKRKKKTVDFENIQHKNINYRGNKQTTLPSAMKSSSPYVHNFKYPKWCSKNLTIRRNEHGSKICSQVSPGSNCPVENNLLGNYPFRETTKLTAIPNAVLVKNKYRKSLTTWKMAQPSSLEKSSFLIALKRTMDVASFTTPSPNTKLYNRGVSSWRRT